MSPAAQTSRAVLLKFESCVTESDPSTSQGRKRRELSGAEFEALLAALDSDRERAGDKYENLRRRLINLFTWEQCDAPDHLSDEVLNRLSRKLMEGATVPHLDRFAFGIARLVIQEEIRGERNRRSAMREMESAGATNSGAWSRPEQSIADALRQCLDALPADRRDLITRYYREDRNVLARTVGVSLNALRNRAMRIREELLRCVARRRDES